MNSSGFDINSVNLGPGITTPVSGNIYNLNNLAFSHWLDNNGGGIEDGNLIIAWSLDSPASSEQEWEYLTYPNTAGQTVFTLQSIITTEAEQRSFNGRGGYLRVDPLTNKLVQGGVPMGWILTEAAPQIYSFSPFDDVFSQGGRLTATDMNSTLNPKNVALNQVELQVNEETLTQFWTFNTPQSSFLGLSGSD